MPIDEGKIRGELSTLPENFIVLFLTGKDNQVETSDFMMKYLLKEKNMEGIYITLNRNAELVMETMKSAGIDAQKIFFVDCSSVTKKHKKGSYILVLSPKNLTDIGVVLSEFFKSNPMKKFLILDSVSSLLSFNNVKSVVSFSQFLLNLIKENKINGVMIAQEKGTDEFVMRNFYTFSDKVINA
jgi:hypothetical protein